ncbi:hypothetical protein [Streptococcus sobrinus]|uniref:hypothetical protein n=1 Tax=Streptococcus sobrinus TaxID=1310 RepID=UPI0002E903BC|nr:hypothetical protein [Streptococcus sobrinus]
MYKAINAGTGEVHEYTTFDSLSFHLEQLNNKHLGEGTFAEYQVQDVDKKQNILAQIQLTLPKPSREEIEADLSILHAQKAQAVQKERQAKKLKARSQSFEETPTEAAPSGQPVQPQVQPSRTKCKPGLLIINLVVALVSILALIVSLSAVKQVSKVSKDQPAKTAVVSQPSTEDHGPDVFVRYFLASYLSQSSELDYYLSSDADPDDFKYESKATPGSVLLEKTTKKGNKTTLTYVISLKEEDKSTTKRVTFSIKEDSKAKYGYVVTEKPKMSDYPG